MKNIVKLNGVARKNVNTAVLVHAFTDGAQSFGSKVMEVYLQGISFQS